MPKYSVVSKLWRATEKVLRVENICAKSSARTRLFPWKEKGPNILKLMPGTVLKRTEHPEQLDDPPLPEQFEDPPLAEQLDDPLLAELLDDRLLVEQLNDPLLVEQLDDPSLAKQLDDPPLAEQLDDPPFAEQLDHLPFAEQLDDTLNNKSKKDLCRRKGFIGGRD